MQSLLFGMKCFGPPPMPNCPGERSSAENSEENPMQRRDIAFGNEQRGPGYAVCEIQYTVDASDRETDEVLAVENFKEAQHRKKPSNFNEKVHQIFIVQRAVEERTWENVVDEPVCDFIRTDYETEKPHGERDKADEEEEREVIVFLWFVHDIKSLCWEVSGVEPFEQSEIWKELLAHESEICRLKRSERVLYTILGAIAGAVIVLVIRTA
jgi:hypothetical protein